MQSMPKARAFFATWTPPAESAAGPPSPPLATTPRCTRRLVRSTWRSPYGAMDTSPRNWTRSGRRPLGDPSLEAATHGVTDDDLRALPRR